MKQLSLYIRKKLGRVWVENSKDVFKFNLREIIKQDELNEFLKIHPKAQEFVNEFYSIINNLNFEDLFSSIFNKKYSYMRKYSGPFHEIFSNLIALGNSFENENDLVNTERIVQNALNSISSQSSIDAKKRMKFVRAIVADLKYAMNQALRIFIQKHPLRYSQRVSSHHPSAAMLKYSQKAFLINNKNIMGISIEGAQTRQSILIIPSHINQLPVLEISYGAFQNQQELLMVVLPNTLRFLAGKTFANLRNLKEMYVSSKLSFTGEQNFWGSKKFTFYWTRNNEEYFYSYDRKSIALSESNHKTEREVSQAGVFYKDRDGTYKNAKTTQQFSETYYQIPEEKEWNPLLNRFLGLYYPFLIPSSFLIAYYFLNWTMFAFIIVLIFFAIIIFYSFYLLILDALNPIKLGFANTLKFIGIPFFLAFMFFLSIAVLFYI